MTPALHTYLADVRTSLTQRADLDQEAREMILETLSEQLEELLHEGLQDDAILVTLPSPSSFSGEPNAPIVTSRPPAQTTPLQTPRALVPIASLLFSIGGLFMGLGIGIIGSALHIQDADHGGFVFFFAAQVLAFLLALPNLGHTYARTAAFTSFVLVGVSLLLPVLFP